MTLLEFLRLTRANILLLLLGLLLGALAGLGYASLQPKVYTASSSGYVTFTSSNDPSDYGPGDAFSGDQAAQAKAKSYVPLLTSAPVAEKIQHKTGTPLSPQQIQGSISASVEDNSTLIRVQTSASTAEDAAKLANTALEATADEVREIEGKHSTVRVIPLDDAVQPGGPSSPSFRRLALLGAAAGLFLAYVAVFVRRYSDVKIRTSKDLESVSSVGVLGMLPRSAAMDENSLVRGEGDHQSEEALRQLRTNLRFVSVDHPPRSIIITSPNPGEGKSTVSANLAYAFAQSGQPTVLIDADLRRPTVAKVFGLDNSVGLSQVLSGQVPLEDALQRVGETGLYVIPAGRIPPNPSELLGSEKMHRLIEELKQEHFVLVDVPPLLPVTDGALLSAGVDGTILVVSVGSTRKDQTKAASEMVDRVQGTLLGTVMNKTPLKGVGSEFYGFGYSGYRSGYQAYYGPDGKRLPKLRGRRRTSR